MDKYILHVQVHCPCCMSMFMLHVHDMLQVPVYAVFHVYVPHVHAQAVSPSRCCVFKSTLNVHVNSACSSQFCMFKSMLHVRLHAAWDMQHGHKHSAWAWNMKHGHGQAACSGTCSIDMHMPYTCCMSKFMSMPMLDVRVHAACASTCCVFLSMLHDHVYAVEEDATRGTTTLVYLQLHTSLYVLSRVLEYIR
jgi:hypothetical protein